MENLSNVFDALLQADINRQKLIKSKELKIEAEELGNICGSCIHWMTSQCKREKTKLVSCRELKCSDFTINKFSSDLISKKLTEATELEQLLKQNRDETTQRT